VGWEAERAEDAYWMHGPNWPFDDSDYTPDTDEDPWRADERHAAERAEARDEQEPDQALLGDYSGRLYSETRVDQERRETTERGRKISARVRALTQDGWGAQQIDLVLSQVAAEERNNATREDTQPVPDDPEAMTALDEIMDAFHGLPIGTTRKLRSRNMGWAGADEYARTNVERARRQGHGGWQPGEARTGKAMSVGFPVNPLLILDVLAKAAMGFGQEKSRFPSEPPEGSVLKWVKTFKRNPEQGYTYVALHVNGAWYLSGKHADPMTWDDLVVLIGDSPCELATNWMEIPKPKKDDLDGLTPEEWFLVAFPQDIVDGDQDGKG
jgi:hypothetical protein